MAILKFNVGDRVVSCYAWSNLDQRLEMSQKPGYGMWHPGRWSKNGRTGTITKITRNDFGRIDTVAVEWDVDYNEKGKNFTGLYGAGFDPKKENLPLACAIRYLHPIEHCNTCKHRLLRLSEGSCFTRKYEMNHKAFVNKWRKRLETKTEDENGTAQADSAH